MDVIKQVGVLWWCWSNKKLSWSWQTRATRIEVSQGH